MLKDHHLIQINHQKILNLVVVVCVKEIIDDVRRDLSFIALKIKNNLTMNKITII